MHVVRNELLVLREAKWLKKWMSWMDRWFDMVMCEKVQWSCDGWPKILSREPLGGAGNN